MVMCVCGEGGGVRFNIKKYIIFNCENWKWKLDFKETMLVLASLP